MKRYLLISILIITLFFSGQVKAEELTATSLLDEVASALKQVKDFKGTVVSKIYLDDQVIDYYAQIMKSKTRSMSQNNFEENKNFNIEEVKLLNAIPLIYLPPDYNMIKNSLPIGGQSNYQDPFYNLDNFYDMELLGESVYKEREVYIIQLENMFVTQRLFFDKERRVISKIEIFNGANIKLVSINYSNFVLFDPNIYLPMQIEVKNSRDRILMEIIYQNWDVNIGLTDFDFAKGFDDTFKQQIEQLKNKIKYSPRNDKLYWLLSDLYKKDGNLDAAVASLKDAIRIKDALKYRKRLVELYQLQGKYREALAEVRLSLQSNYNNSEMHYLSGEIQLQLGKIDRARNSIEKAVELDPDNSLYLEKLYLIYSSLADGSNRYMFDRARRVANKLVDLEPKNKKYRIYLGDIYLEQGEKLKAINSYNKAIELSPQDTWGYIKLAQFYKKTNQEDKAEELYRYVLYLDDSLENQKRLANFYFEQGKYKLALKEYKSLNNRSTGDLELRLRLAESHLAMEENQKGLEIFDKILKEYNNGDLYLKVGSLVSKYNLDAAIDIYHLALNTEGLLTSNQIEEVYKRLGYIYFEEKSQDKTKELDQILKINSQAKIYQLLGEYNFAAGDLEKAISYFKLAVDREESFENHYNLAVSYLLVDHFALAKNETNKLIKEGYLKESKNLLQVIDDMIKIQEDYSNIYQPGRINRIKGDKFRKQGKFNQALLKYKESISENYDYELSYIYIGVISGLKGDHLQLQLAKNGLKDKELELLEEILLCIEKVKEF
ncbi:DUF4292 domain-containing protein [Orenia marismortui]|uniref:DUF4292 domain-containing protein n=1 Tax=Orenia marismortui TaxID=46469 RepID=UPI000370983E|nr:DUF4292 domain-containing protein [Orenia marismortui]